VGVVTLVVDNRIIYSAVQAKLKQLFKDENINLPKMFFGNFLKLMSKICTYEEEETKIRPNIFLGSNIVKGAFSQLPYKIIIPIQHGNKAGDDLERILKSLLPFCNAGWYVYININDDYLEYGLIRTFGGPKGLSVTEVLFENKGIDLSILDYGLIEIKVMSKFEMCITGLRRNRIIVDFRLVPHNESSCDYGAIAIDMTSGIVIPAHKEVLKNIFSGLLRIASQRVHGTILLVVKAECVLPNNFLTDGRWLPQPVDLAEKALQAITNSSDAISVEAFIALSGLFLQMLSVDGITIVDNLGRLRGFNVFVNAAAIQDSGGARKRAANTVLKSKQKDFIGVYFQSQDEHTFYERVNADD
jgi:hypothetical protein